MGAIARLISCLSVCLSVSSKSLLLTDLLLSFTKVLGPKNQLLKKISWTKVRGKKWSQILIFSLTWPFGAGSV